MNPIYCLGFFVTSVQALQVLVSPVVDIINGVVQRTQTLSIQCTSADFGQTMPFNITSAAGSVHTMQIFCPPLALQYSMSLVGYVPHYGQLTSRGLYTLNTVPLGVDTSATLLSQSIGTTVGTPTAAPTSEGNRLSKLASKGSKNHFALSSFWSNVACAAAGQNAMVYQRAGCGGGVSKEDIDKLQHSFDTLADTTNTRLNALQGFQNATSVWETQATANALQTAAVTTALAQSMATASVALQEQQSINYQVQNALQEVVIAQRTSLNQVNANLAAVNANLAADVAGLQQSIALMFNKTYKSMYDLQVNLTNAINSVAQQTYHAIQVCCAVSPSHSNRTRTRVNAS